VIFSDFRLQYTF